MSVLLTRDQVVDQVAAGLDAGTRARVRELVHTNYAAVVATVAHRTRKYREPDPYHPARSEHAFLLRCEGMTLAEIGRRLGCSQERARQHVLRFGRILSHRLQFVRVTVETERGRE